MPEYENGTLTPTFASSACDAAINPLRVAREIVKTDAWDMQCMRNMDPKILADVEKRVANVVRVDGVMADKIMDYYQQHPNERTPDQAQHVNEYFPKRDQLREPGIRDAVAKYASGQIDRLTADHMIVERQAYWARELPEKMEEIRHPEDHTTQAGLQRDTNVGLSMNTGGAMA
jgi:hypothetical protein